MVDQKVTALGAIAAATVDDLLYLIEDPLGVPLSKKITFDNFQKSITDVGVIATGTWNAGFGANAIGDADIDWGTGAGQISAVDIPIADAGIIITGTEVETALQENRTAIDLNTLKDTNVSTDLSAGARTATTIKVDSSDGTDATLVEADTTNAGILGSDKWDEIVANSLKVTYDDAGTVAANAAHVIGDGSDHADVATNTLKETNVSTDLSVGTVGINTVAITSDGGADDVTIPAATITAAGCLTTVKWAEIVANTLKDTNVSTDLSLGDLAATTMNVNSSDGTNATLIEADTTNAGLLGSDKWDEIVANTAKDTNVTTNLSLGVGNATTEVVACSDGTDCTLIEADTDNAGLLGADKWDEIVANSLKDTNVTTNLSLGVGNATTEVVACSDGTDCTLIEADTDNAGLLGADKWDEIVANTAAKHTQNTDTALGSGCVAADHGTAATDQVINICYGTGEPPTANTTTEGALFVKYTA